MCALTLAPSSSAPVSSRSTLKDSRDHAPNSFCYTLFSLNPRRAWWHRGSLRLIECPWIAIRLFQVLLACQCLPAAVAATPFSTKLDIPRQTKDQVVLRSSCLLLSGRRSIQRLDTRFSVIAGARYKLRSLAAADGRGYFPVVAAWNLGRQSPNLVSMPVKMGSAIW